MYFGFQKIMTKIIKNLKPIETDASFIYSCPSCSCKHWLSLKEARTKNFLVVCDCDTTFSVKTIRSIKILYKKTLKTEITKTDSKSLNEIPVDFLNRCCKVLVDYGFTKEESKSMLQKAYDQNPSLSISDLIKLCLSNFGEKNV